MLFGVWNMNICAIWMSVLFSVCDMDVHVSFI